MLFFVYTFFRVLSWFLLDGRFAFWWVCVVLLVCMIVEACKRLLSKQKLTISVLFFVLSYVLTSNGFFS